MGIQWNPSCGSSLHCFQVELYFGNFCSCGGRKTGVPGEEALDQVREPTTNSTHIYRDVAKEKLGRLIR